MINAEKQYFRYTQAIRAIRQSLKTPTLRDRFTSAVEAFGLSKKMPDFEGCEELEEAFGRVLSELQRGHDVTTNAARPVASGSAAMYQPTRAAQNGPTASDPQEPEGPRPSLNLGPTQPMPTKPRHDEPAAEWVARLKASGCVALLKLDPAAALSEGEFIWLSNWLGFELASGMVFQLEASLSKTPDLLEKRGEANCLDLLANAYTYSAKVFAEKLDTFKHTTKTGEAVPLSQIKHPLTLSQYHQLRARYGKANIWRKICEMCHQKAPLNWNREFAPMLRQFIEASLKAAPNSKHHYPTRFDDVGQLTSDGTGHYIAHWTDYEGNTPFDAAFCYPLRLLADTSGTPE